MDISGEMPRTARGSGKQMDDDKIISLYWKREERAIEETQTKYGKLCYSTAYGVVRNREDAEECVNDTYVRAWNSIPPDEPDNFAGYLCRIARNLAIDRIKAYTAEKRSGQVAIMDELEGCFPMPSEVERIVDKISMTKAFERFLSSEPPSHRMIFMRRYFYLDSVSDIAKMLRMTDVSVRVTLHRIRKKLKKYLEEEGITI